MFLPLKRLTLREKTLLFFCLTLTGLSGVVYFASSKILLGSLETAERQSARQSLQGVFNVLAKDQESFAGRYSDWSAWDDTYTFIQNRNESYIKSNLVPEQLMNLKVNLALFVNTKGRIIYSTEFDFNTKRIQPVSTELIEQLAIKKLLSKALETRTSLTGILPSSKGLVLVTCQPILTSQKKGPAQGVLIFGRWIDNSFVNDLSRITRFSIQLHSLHQATLPPEIQTLRQSLSLGDPISVHFLNETTMIGDMLLTDLYSRPALILQIEIPRENYQQQRNSQQYLMLAIVLSGLAFGGVGLLILEWLILGRLTSLSTGVNQIQASRNLALRLPASGQDEISSLTHNINTMLETLESAQVETQNAFDQVTHSNQGLQTAVEQLQTEILERQRIESALRQSEAQLTQQTQSLEQTLLKLQQAQLQLIQSEKMSSLGQLVAGIAHEINNPISFVHGNLTFAQNYIEALLQLVQLYQQEYPDPTPNLKFALEQIEFEFMVADLPKTLNSMQTGTDRIQGIVRSLRIFSHLDEAEVKAVDIHEGIDSTLLILQSRLKANGNRSGIAVVKKYGQIPLIECYAGQLNQVFMNVLVNAIDVLEEANRTEQDHSNCITICTSVVGQQWVKISIADNGSGISPSIQSRIFDPFFTTKPIGKGTGMGMSISYQIITEKHRGTLECFSVPGEGTEFVIQIPIRQLVGVNPSRGTDRSA